MISESDVGVLENLVEFVKTNMQDGDFNFVIHQHNAGYPPQYYDHDIPAFMDGETVRVEIRYKDLTKQTPFSKIAIPGFSNDKAISEVS